MSLPYFPMYPTDFEAKTSHLTLAEDGAYNRILRMMWMTPGCTLPADDKWLMRRLRVDRQTFDEVVKVVLDEFFTIKNGRLRSDMLDGWVSDARKTDKRPWVPLSIQRFVAERDGDVCKYCGSTDGPFHLDHIHPWALGGEHTPENLTIACAQCNWSKGSKPLGEWRGF